jgi:hypothetical protein
MLSRRRFLQLTAAAGGGFAFTQARSQDSTPLPPAEEGISFFLVGDTHYLANKNKPDSLDQTSLGYTSRLIETLNFLPETPWPDALGGGKVPAPKGLIHAGDCIDSGDRTGPVFEAMQRTEMAAFRQHFGLNGEDGRLRFPVREVHGNHDAPQGRGLALEIIRERNKTRNGLAAVSPNGVHYSWDWGNVHFVNLGIVVGSAKDVERPRRYPPLDSLDFLISDLAEKVGNSGKPVIITHHIDVARYCAPIDDPARAAKNEWDFADVAAYHEVLRKYRVAGILHGHTHQRRIFAWDGTPPGKNEPKDGIPVFNTGKAAHFNSESQAFLHFQMTDREIIAREYFTEEGWQHGAWRPRAWRYALRA